MIEKITRHPIKDAFKNEAYDFTPWLCANIDVVGEAINIELRGAEREQSTDNFSVDIKAEDSDGNVVVIENQYGISNHDHLGKLITYTTSFNAKIAIWIVELPKQEHINAIAWLNERDNGCDFYLLKLEAIRIGESSTAPLLSLISGPSIESRQIGLIKKEQTDQEKLRKEFWDMLLQFAANSGLKNFSTLTVSGKDAWLGCTAGIKGLTYVFWVNQFSTRIELRIDRGKGLDEENLKILNILKQSQEKIESEFGMELNWADLEGYRVCSIRKDLETGGYKSSKQEWPTTIQNTVTSMLKLIKATKKELDQLKNAN